ncbi:Diaminopimelate epimerase [Thioalkalivibrio nitratireducens DSM 14787]|uniref:Diaminopimelate epimerase n=1 Tax=Thioalkalivibrio nitratireducens (strain DSM 14787 / UNIQEM 213 / ALEN2) TaxID=1255043 RepID=L0DQN0_THIND|nr:diaminopimelate epimerase [Thioalkalivibrio nitratireducens]AGA31794.1 Diaminopimelate epimerase [Thioalkalivibrio nitratireducens DSM 14787]
MKLAFTKMHGLGNDFVVIDGVRQRVNLDPEAIRFLADRHFGIGCDQVLLVERPVDPSRALFRYRIFNADGGEVEQCGNGARCFAVFVREQGLTQADTIPVETLSGPIELRVEADGQVTVNMGRPRFHPDQLPFLAPTEVDEYPLEVDGEPLRIGAVSMGNPHAVLLVDAVATAPVERLGPAIEHHPRFPDRVNVGFAAVRARDRIDLRVWERGAGETLACGTGACAAMAVARRRGLVDTRVRVDLPGGSLVLSWSGESDQPVWMTGPATTVFHGRIER